MELPRRNFLSLLFDPLLLRFRPARAGSASLNQIEPGGHIIGINRASGPCYTVTDYYWIDSEGRCWRWSNLGGCFEGMSIPFVPFVVVPETTVLSWQNGDEYRT